MGPKTVAGLVSNLCLARTVVQAHAGKTVVAGDLGGDAAIFEANTLTCTSLNWINPNARGEKAPATAVNSAGWVVGRVSDGKGMLTFVFWREGELWDFSEIAPSTFWLEDINQAGMIVGDVGRREIRVAIPSRSPPQP